MARKKNRKKRSGGFIFPAPLAGILGLAALVSLSYLWFCGRCEAVGAHIKVLEETKTEIHKQVINEEFKLSNMKSPQNIRDLLHRFNLNMTWPEKGQVVRLTKAEEDFRPVEYVENTRQYAHYIGLTRND